MRFAVFVGFGLALTACAGVGVPPSGENGVALATPATVPAPTNITGLTADDLPQVVSTGPALDLDWNRRYQAGVAYVNITGRGIPIYSGPDGQSRIGTLPPGNGGAIDACAVEVDACSIAFGESRQRGWVLMDAMGLQSAEETANL